jgi:PAS domain-containing protein
MRINLCGKTAVSNGCGGRCAPGTRPTTRVGGIVVFSEDITKRKEAEEAVKDLQAILSEAEAVANIGSWRWDLATQKVTWSNQMFTLFGVDPETFDGDVERMIQPAYPP